MPTARRRPTIYDVAHAAQVSLATASRALSGTGAASAGARARVRQAAESIGYRPGIAAVSLSGRRPPLIGVASYFSDAWAQTEILWGLAEELHASELHVVFSPWFWDRAARVDTWLLDAIDQRLLGGLIVVSPNSAGTPVLEAAVRERLPVVTVEFRFPGAHAVTVDNVLGGRLAGEWLGPRCRRFVAFNGGEPSMPPFMHDRVRGFRDGVAGGDRPAPRVDMPRSGPGTFANGVAAGRRLTLAAPLPVGLFTPTGDMFALGLRQGLAARGAKAGREYHLVGYDGLAAFRDTAADLVTVRQPLTEMGRQAGRLMRAAFNAPRQAPEDRVLKPVLLSPRAAAVGSRRPGGARRG